MNRPLTILLVVFLLALLWFTWNGIRVEVRPQLPAPKFPVVPLPKVPDLPRPRKPCPKETETVGAKVGGSVAPDGVTEIQCDLPGALHQKNTGGSDGAGLCVYASARHTGRWQNDPLFEAVFDWMKRHPGGSYPEKFDRTLKQCAKELGLPVPAYLQIVNSRDLEPLRRACRTGRMVGITYGRSPTGRYGGQSISHMVSLPHCDERWAAVLDNNYLPGDRTSPDNYEWMDPEKELLGVANPRGYWAIVLLTPPGPPPVPRNQ